MQNLYVLGDDTEMEMGAFCRSEYSVLDERAQPPMAYSRERKRFAAPSEKGFQHWRASPPARLHLLYNEYGQRYSL